ncbi:MAG: aminomethyl-transferring glycine dehydrogenase subunit GcvPB [Treponema sp.]|nr:aminomethyl-transferring glycine dehydrogenase subunit GcvPB [Treponema sp.]
MKLIFEKSKKGRGCSILPACDVPPAVLPEKMRRKNRAALPSMDENEISRHYSAMAKRAFGVNDGFYPLGSCTMKYNPKLNEEIAGLPGFRDIHPLQSADTVQGCLKVLDLASEYLKEISGMDAMSFQPAAGAQGELTGLLLFKAYHHSRGETGRTKIIIPDSAHGTNPATATMAGFEVVNLASNASGCIDLKALKAAAGPDTAGLMLTNPNTLGIFDPNILEITSIVHNAGGLNYYDGANLNAIMGIVRPGDMGFDAVHLNLHKSFSTPHGGGGPGSGVVGCKKALIPFMPLGAENLTGNSNAGKTLTISGSAEFHPQSIGRVRSFYGNFLIVLRAAAYLLFLGKENIPETARASVLNANYLMEKLKGKFHIPCITGHCMHEFVISLEELKARSGVSALDMAKALQDQGMHPPTVYFPLIVHEALMVEPTETESKETLDAAADAFIALYDRAMKEPESLSAAPVTTVIGRPDDVKAARQPVVCYRC